MGHHLEAPNESANVGQILLKWWGMEPFLNLLADDFPGITRKSVKPYLNHWFPGFSSHSAQAPKVLCFLGQDGPHCWPISSPKWEYIWENQPYNTNICTEMTLWFVGNRWSTSLSFGSFIYLLQDFFRSIWLFAFLKKTSPWENLPKGQQLSFYKHIATFQESIAEVFHSPIENIWTYIMGHDPKTILLPIDMAPFILHNFS